MADAIKRVTKDGTALQHESIEFLGNEAVVTAAVQKNGNALQYPHDLLRNDEDVVTEAVKQNSLAIMNASSRLTKKRIAP